MTNPEEDIEYKSYGLVLEKSCILNSLAANSPILGMNPAAIKIPKTYVASDILAENPAGTETSESISTIKLNAVLTAYSSTVEECDDTPFVTAQGTAVRDGIVANNLLPFGTKIRIPEIYGDKVFTVEDRMNAKQSKYQFDLWFPSHEAATDFGVKRTYIEIVN
ncbi:MAG: hypothetical protein WC397_04370 [Candidatus Paceibacterota bacterium]